jgi:antiviral helicase SKI2
MLKKEGLTPAVVFSFSKKKCEECADALQSLDLTDAAEKSEVHVVCSQACNRLEQDDAYLPQVLRVKSMLRRGVVSTVTLH